MANINKQHFLLAGSCAVVLSVFSRSSVGKIGDGKEKIKRKPILRKVLFREKAPEYHSGAINKEKHLQGRCCDQWAQKCLGSRDMLNHASGTSERRNFSPHANGVSELLFVLCIALTPQSGDSSGAILGVRSVALLHPQFSGNTEAQMTINNTRAHGCACVTLIYPSCQAIQ